jgi:hypothetical protein
MTKEGADNRVKVPAARLEAGEAEPAGRIQAARLQAIEGLAARIEAPEVDVEREIDADLVRAFTELCGAAEKAANAPDLKELDILGQKLRALTEKNEALHRAASRGEVKLG